MPETTQSLVTGDRVMGTPDHLAPEVILGQKPIDHRVDIYALGCVAYSLLTAERVFPAQTVIRCLFDHAHTVPVPPSQRSSLPIAREVDDLVLACLEKTPEKRPQNVGVLLQRIDACADAGTWSNGDAEAWWGIYLPAVRDLGARPAPAGDARA